MTSGREEDYVGVAAILVDPSGLRDFFGGWVCDDEVSKWKAMKNTWRVIHQAEIHRILLAFYQWPRVLAVVIVDNDRVKGSVVDGSSMARVEAQLVHQVRTQTSTWGASGVFDRKNLADGPSVQSGFCHSLVGLKHGLIEELIVCIHSYLRCSLPVFVPHNLSHSNIFGPAAR